ncbi:MAG: hypothetical protein KJS97_12525 [Alphaproteobacteria bacterium]|nr:hypothetical protein [Alphaproteobacteria bacterium]
MVTGSTLEGLFLLNCGLAVALGVGMLLKAVGIAVATWPTVDLAHFAWLCAPAAAAAIAVIAYRAAQRAGVFAENDEE